MCNICLVNTIIEFVTKISSHEKVVRLVHCPIFTSDWHFVALIQRVCQAHLGETSGEESCHCRGLQCWPKAPDEGALHGTSECKLHQRHAPYGQDASVWVSLSRMIHHFMGAQSIGKVVGLQCNKNVNTDKRLTGEVISHSQVSQ